MSQGVEGNQDGKQNSETNGTEQDKNIVEIVEKTNDKTDNEIKTMDNNQAKEETKLKETINKLDNASASIDNAGRMIILAAVLKTSLKGLEVVADVGSSLPVIGSALVIVGMLTRKYQEQTDLHIILEELANSLHNCNLLIKYIEVTIRKFKDVITTSFAKIPKEITKETLNELLQIKMNPKTEILLSAKITILIKLLETICGNNTCNQFEINPKKDTSSNNVTSSNVNNSGFISKISNRFSNAANSAVRLVVNFGSSKTYKEQLMTQLNLINTLLIHYDSQFHIVVSTHEHFLSFHFPELNIYQEILNDKEVKKAREDYLENKESTPAYNQVNSSINENKTNGGKRKTRRNKKSKPSRRAVRKTGPKKKTQKKRPNKRGIKMYGK